MTTKTGLEIVFIVDDACRAAKLRNAIRHAGLDCTIRRLRTSSKATAYLARAKHRRNAAVPDLVFFDLADPIDKALKNARRVAVGKWRSQVPVVFLTSPASERALARGDLDNGRLTMFAARPLESFLSKLANDGQNGFLRALTTLYQYGPLLAQQPKHLLENQAQ